MTQEEKAKAYDEALWKAKTHINTKGIGDTVDLCKHLFPELAESEDERIRKEIVGVIQKHYPNTPESYRWISWLEKQKDEGGYEAIPVESTLEYKLGFKAGRDSEKQKDNKFAPRVLPCSAAWFEDGEEKQKEQKPKEPDWCHHKVDLSGCSEEYMKAYYDGWNNCNQQHSQCKAEQKPAEKQDYSGLNDLERAILRGFLAAGIENVSVTIIKETAKECLAQMEPVEWSKAIINGEPIPTENQSVDIPLAEWSDDIIRKAVKEVGLTQHQIDWFKTNVFSPKQEWSEEDRNITEELYEYFRYLQLTSDKEFSPSLSIDEILEWLKSLPLNLKKKNEDVAKLCSNEWSEEDEKYLNRLINFLVDVFGEDSDTVKWLKSLRPSWKPSKEQMEALKCAIEDIAKFSKRGGRQVEFENEPYYMALHSLYCNLEKLM